MKRDLHLESIQILLTMTNKSKEKNERLDF